MMGMEMLLLLGWYRGGGGAPGSVAVEIAVRVRERAGRIGVWCCCSCCW